MDNNIIDWKGKLLELCVKEGISKPDFKSVQVNGIFKCSLDLLGITFESDNFQRKRQAERHICQKAFTYLDAKANLIKASNIDMSSDEKQNYKGKLLELCLKECLNKPDFKTVQVDDKFKCSLDLFGSSFESEGCQRKRDAEREVSRQALKYHDELNSRVDLVYTMQSRN
jgi:hypothetical protein